MIRPGGGEGRGVRVAAHRGGAQLWPENSLRAFAGAVALGVDLVELDVHAAADGGLVVIHDPTLDRTTEAQGPVAARPTAELRRLRLRGPDGRLTEERLPTLAEVVALVGASEVGLLVEVKGPVPGPAVSYERQGGAVRLRPGLRYEGLEERLVRVLHEGSVLERTAVMAFNPDVLTLVRELVPGLPTALLVARAHVLRVAARPEEAVDWAMALSATDLGLEASLVDHAVVARARKAGVRLGAWTVNDEASMHRLAALGVDVITTDRPDLARKVLRR